MAKLRRSPRRARKYKAIRSLEQMQALVADAISPRRQYGRPINDTSYAINLRGMVKKLKRSVRRAYVDLDR